MKHIDAIRISGKRGAALCCVAVLGQAADIIVRYCSGWLLDHGTDNAGIRMALPGLSIICIITLFLKYLGPYAEDRFEAFYTGILLSGLEERLLYSRQEQIDRKNTGEFSTCLSSDVTGILQYVKRMLWIFFPDMVSLVICVCLIMSMKFMLGLAALVSGLASVFLMTRLSRSMADSLNAYQEKLKKVNGLAFDGLFNLEMVKVSMMENDLAERYAESLGQLHKRKRKVAFRQAVLSAPTMALSFLTLLSTALCGGYYAIAGQISMGQLLSAIVLSDYIVSPVMRFQNTLVQYRRARVNLGNYSSFEGMVREEESVSRIKASSECSIDRLSFQYPEGKRVFDGLQFHFEKGKINYIVGNNGSGKSTLLKIISGVYGLSGGEICLPVRSNDRTSIRTAISVMPQESLVFADSIKANLLAGTACPVEKMYAMCKSLGLHEEILQMEKGYDTVLKEKGSPLSGGQKRRIAFIRCVLREAELYTFDEPTANVDAGNSIRMMEYISGLAECHYVVMITHDRDMMAEYPGVVHDMREA